MRAELIGKGDAPAAGAEQDAAAEEAPAAEEAFDDVLPELDEE